MHVNWLSTASPKPKSTPYANTAQQLWHPLDFPRAMVEHRSRPPSELVEFLKFLRGKSKSISQQVELRALRPPSPTSHLFHASGTGRCCTRANPPWQGTLVDAALQGGQSTSHRLVLQKTEPLSSLAAPIISLIPLTPATFITKEKSYIWTQKEKKKIIFTKFVQYTHLIFYGTHCTRGKRAMALKQVYISSAVTTNGDLWKPVFSVLLEHRAFLMAPAKDNRLLFPSGAMMLHLISPNFKLVLF